MPLEIERTFLVEKPDDICGGHDVSYRVFKINQSYLLPVTRYSGEDKVPASVERIRRMWDVTDGSGELKFYHTEKTHIAYGINEEVEREISSDVYDKISLTRWDSSTKIIAKKRHVFEWNGLVWELDQFMTPVDIWLLEVELPSMEEEIDLPDWIKVIKEVTDDYRYTNHQIAHGRLEGV
jgi:CYTH domain-containing protein